jgi:hypothetical protein
MNSIGWIVGHLAWQEQRYLVHRPHGIMLREDIQKEFAFGAPMSTPPLKEMLAAWRTITTTADPFIDQLTPAKLLAIRQQLGEKNLPVYVGSIEAKAPYRPV